MPTETTITTSDRDLGDDGKELLARDRDVRSPATADLDEDTAQQAVRELLHAGTVTQVVNQRILVHEPSRTPFESTQQLAVFHEMWKAA